MAIVGIDLGTTNSLVSVWQEDSCTLIPNNLGEYLTPSVVGVDENGEILVGRTAKERLISHPDRTAASFKRFMGTEEEFFLGGRRFSASDLSSFVLKQLKEDAEAFLKEPVEEAVISVPAYFNDLQRNATKIAGELAGFRVERIVNEPSAAALAYRFGKMEEDQTFLVFDFGGGTLDISIVDAFDNVVEITAVAGDNHLGGDDINKAIAEKFLSVSGLDFGMLTKEEWAALLKASEKLKMELSKSSQAEMETVISGRLYGMQMDSRGLLEASTQIMESIGMPLTRALSDGGYEWKDIDDIILVGGSSKMPLVQNYLQFLSGKKPLSRIDPDVAVAVGVGMYAGIKERMAVVKDMMLTDICPFTLGIEVSQEDREAPSVMSPIIERNSVLPVSRAARYFTANPFQQFCTVVILQGEHRIAKQNLCLGRLEVPVPMGKTEQDREAIDVRYTYDMNGILEIDVTVVSTQEKTSKVIVNPSIRLSEEEIQKRREELQKLKIHPRDQEKNRLLLARGDRVFEENTGDVRKYTGRFMGEFTAALNTQDARKIEKAYIRTNELLNIIENSPKRSVILRLDKYLYDEWRKDS
ncbi:MAG: molecular chaperone HscC [Coprococcus sp.]|nr:molecular chaperone HscC [Coprococcus sp.]